MNVKFEDTIKIGVVLPRPLAAAIDSLAERELIARSTWVRRTILNAIKAEKAAA